MGFPIGYSDLLLPKLLLNVLLLLSLLRRLISFAFHSFGLDVEPQERHHHHQYYHTYDGLKATMMREALPSALLYEDLVAGGAHTPAVSCCAVCLHEFVGSEEVRRLARCRHVFHRRCLDPWVELDQWTCPLCRAPITTVPPPVLGDSSSAHADVPPPHHHHRLFHLHDEVW